MGKNIKYSLTFFVRLQGNFIHSFAFKGFVGAWDSHGAAGLELLFPIKHLCSQIRAPPDPFALQHLSSKLGSLAFGKRVTTCWGFKQKSLGFKTSYLASWWFSRMEDRGSVQQAENDKRCQIEGCNDVTVGARTSLCRKHRNNKYKQNYKKKKRKAQGSEENQGETPESQLAAEKYYLEQKYASMLQQVLVQKRLELLQSPSICNLLRIHQQSVREDKQVQLLEKRKAAQGEHNSKMQQEKQSKPLSSPNISTSGASNICNSGTTTKTANGPSKATSSSKTLTVKSSKQSSRPPQGRNPSKHSKNRNNSNSSVESPLNGLIVPHSKITSNGSESVAHALYASSASWNLNEKKAEFCNIRQVQNLQQQITPQPMLVNTTQEAFSQQKQEQQKASHNMEVQLLQHHYQQHNLQKDHLQFLQHQNLFEQVHQKQLHEKKHRQQQQQHMQQHQQQHRLQDQQFVHQQQQLTQQRRLQQQRQQELHIQLQNSRQQQQQQLQQQQRQQLQVSGLPNQPFQQQQQLQTCTSSVPSSIKSISDTELFLQSLPSIQSSMSSLLVSQSLVNTSSHDSVHTSGILTSRSSVLPRTLLTNTQGKTPPNIFPISHMGSNAPSVSSHRPIAPRLEGHSSINNTLCNGGMPIITAIISAPLTQQIMPQSGANVERNSIHEVNTHTPMNSSCNALNPQYPLVPFNVQMDLNLLQGVGAQFSEHNMQCASTQVRGRQMLLE